MSSAYDALAQRLGNLADQLTRWLDQPHRWPITSEQQAALQGHARELMRQANALHAQRPTLVVMLMGGTGVGKSSLLNALARGTIAEAAFTRPTTREPIVYLHEKIDVERLDPALRECRLIRHRQEELENKVLVDTPDLDSNEAVHRERLEAVLPAADVVLYVGSQEKYHDQAGWELFLGQRRRRAFAFVLNKWDRCIAASVTGVRPDEDLLRDLRSAGFADPLLFRTCAHAWASSNGAPPRHLPAGEQFPALTGWLEKGLAQREIEAIRNQGIAQLLDQLGELLLEVQPPDAGAAAENTWSAWHQTIREEGRIHAELILACLAPHHQSLARRFGAAIGHPFRGLMGLYTRLINLGRLGFLRSRLPQLQPARTQNASVDDLDGFGRSCASDAFQRSIQARLRALGDRLVAQADDERLPTGGLGEDIHSHLQGLTAETYADQLTRALRAAETSLTGDNSWRKRFQVLWTWIGDLLPISIFLLVLLWQLYAKFFQQAMVSVTDLLLLPPLAALLAMTLLYWVYRWTVPVTWSRLAGIAGEHVRQGTRSALVTAVQGLPQRQAMLLADERRATAEMIHLSRDAKGLLQQQEELAQVAVLYSQ